MVLGGPVDLTGAAGAIMIERQAATASQTEPGTCLQHVKYGTYLASFLWDISPLSNISGLFRTHPIFFPDMSGPVLSDIFHVVDMSGISVPSVISSRDRRTELAIRPLARHLLLHQYMYVIP